jgi:hypothetical protein
MDDAFGLELFDAMKHGRPVGDLEGSLSSRAAARIDEIPARSERPDQMTADKSVGTGH